MKLYQSRLKFFLGTPEQPTDEHYFIFEWDDSDATARDLYKHVSDRLENVTGILPAPSVPYRLIMRSKVISPSKET